MRFYDSLTKKIEDFVPAEPNRIIIYVCGLTPYDSAHIGHARTYVAFDVIKRFLIKKGFQVYHIQNITDVDDKIINRCKETSADPKDLTENTHSEALQLFDRLNILRADIYPKVTEHISDIVKIIKQLLARGYAYENQAGVYYDVSRFASYGSLSGQNMDEIIAGARIEVDERKDDPIDFALWKKTNGQIIEFDSPWGRGRPGWHIECSAMALKYAHRVIDIHGGARDLIFPHHENEIAQSEGATNKKFCSNWLHTGFLTVEGEKMSKSLGNFVTLGQALLKFKPNSLRLFFLLSHYRSPVDYNEEAIESADESIERIFNSIGLLQEVLPKRIKPQKLDPEFRAKAKQFIDSFYSHMENDLNTPEALAAFFNLLRLGNSHIIKEKIDYEEIERIVFSVQDMLWIFGLKQEALAGLQQKSDKLFTLLSEIDKDNARQYKIKNEVEALAALIELRENARKNKDYAKSDLIRRRLEDLQIFLEDTKAGIRWRVKR